MTEDEKKKFGIGPGINWRTELQLRRQYIKEKAKKEKKAQKMIHPGFKKPYPCLGPALTGGKGKNDAADKD